LTQICQSNVLQGVFNYCAYNVDSLYQEGGIPEVTRL